MQHITGVWQKEGLKSLFAGNGANCIRVLPFSALVCVAYSNMAKVMLYVEYHCLQMPNRILDITVATKGLFVYVFFTIVTFIL